MYNNSGFPLKNAAGMTDKRVAMSHKLLSKKEVDKI